MSRFNRYMVECEFSSVVNCIFCLNSFNRYMVECELRCIHISPNVYYVLIDTWWNVNTVYIQDMYRDYRVLIDTWWNVNILVRRLRPGGETVLIDTWWNVNYTSGENSIGWSRFNRYMVECELI